VIPVLGSILVSVGIKLGVKVIATAVKGIVDAADSARPAQSFPALLREQERQSSAAASAIAPVNTVLSVPIVPVGLASRLAFDQGVRGLALVMQSRPLIAAYRRLGGSLG
jgi:hypothetical protein